MNKIKILSLGLCILTLSSCTLSGGNDGSTDGTKEEPAEKVYYDVTFYNDDKVTILYSSTVEEGGTAVYNGTTPTKTSEDPSKYFTFTGWDKELTNIKVDTSFYAVYSENVYEYKCTFNNYDNSLLYETYVEYGKDVEYKGETPTKKGDEGDIYTFTGWDKALTEIKADTIFTAQFSKQKEEYDVKFVNYDDTLLYATTVKHGADVTYKGETPTRPKTAQYNYTFKGWDKGLTEIKADTTFRAQYTEAINIFKCTFYNGDGVTILKTYDVEYGKDVTYDGSTPTKTGEGHNYTFTGWDKELTAIKADTNFYPVFSDVVSTYTVNFYSDDTLTTLLYTATEVPYDTEALYVGETPTKADDEYFAYTFSGWSKDVTKVHENMDVYATFTKTRIKESLTVTNPTNTKMGYTTVEPISGDTYTTSYTYTPLKYSSTYAYDYLGTLSDKDVYQYYYCQIWEGVAGLYASNKDVTTTIQYSDGSSSYVFGTTNPTKYSSFSYSVGFLMGGVQMFRNDNPRAFYLLGSIGYSMNSVSGKFTSVSFIIDDDYLSAASRTSSYSAIDTYVGSVNSTTSALSGEAKARGIYDKIIAGTKYTNTGIDNEHNVLGISNGTGAVCEGYSLMYALCSYALGIETIWYVGTANGISGWVGHAWNASKFGGTWYWIDSTFGDTSENGNAWFKTPDATFSTTHIIETASNGDFDYLPAPSPIA